MHQVIPTMLHLFKKVKVWIPAEDMVHLDVFIILMHFNSMISVHMIQNGIHVTGLGLYLMDLRFIHIVKKPAQAPT